MTFKKLKYPLPVFLKDPLQRKRKEKGGEVGELLKSWSVKARLPSTYTISANGIELQRTEKFFGLCSSFLRKRSLSNTSKNCNFLLISYNTAKSHKNISQECKTFGHAWRQWQWLMPAKSKSVFNEQGTERIT